MGGRENVERRAVRDDGPRVHEDEPVAVTRGKGQIVENHDDRAPLPCEDAQDGQHLHGVRGIETRNRFVGQQYLGRAREKPGDKDASEFSARELRYGTIGEVKNVGRGHRLLHFCFIGL
jgi:hypothetical protein